MLGLATALAATVALTPMPEFKPDSPLARALLAQGYSAVRLEKSSPQSGYLYVRAHVDGKSVLLLLDTGAGHTGLSHEAVKRLGLKAEKAPYPNVGIGGEDKTAAITAPAAFRVGGFDATMSLVVAEFGPSNDRMRTTGEFEIDGVFGASFMTLYGAVVDFDTPALFLRTPYYKEAEPTFGEWQVAKWEGVGAPEPADDLKGWVATISADRFTVGRKGFEFIGRPQFNPFTVPKGIAVELWAGKKSLGAYSGVYQLDGDTLTLCLQFEGDAQSPPPNEFKTKPGDGRSLIRLERVKKK